MTGSAWGAGAGRSEVTARIRVRALPHGGPFGKPPDPQASMDDATPRFLTAMSVSPRVSLTSSRRVCLLHMVLRPRVVSSPTCSRVSSNVTSIAHLSVQASVICCGVRTASVVKRRASRCAPVGPSKSTRRTRPAPRRCRTGGWCCAERNDRRPVARRFAPAARSSLAASRGRDDRSANDRRTTPRRCTTSDRPCPAVITRSPRRRASGTAARPSRETRQIHRARRNAFPAVC